MKTFNTIFSEKHLLLLILIIGLTLVTSACAPRVKPSLFPLNDQTKACGAFLQALDQAAAEAGVNDAAVFRVNGFPYLRTNRFLCGLKDRVTSSEEKDLWIDWMLAENIIARYIEIACLPSEIRERLAGQAGIKPSVAGLTEYAGTCAVSLLTADRQNPNFYESLATAVVCPEEYKTAMRVLGMYPLASLPVKFLTKKAHSRMTRWFTQPSQAYQPKGVVVGYQPAKSTALTTEAVGRIIRESSDNALSIPIPDADARQALVETFAPIILQEITGDKDRPGTIIRQDGDFLVDGDRPTVYFYFTNAFYRNQPILQINYVVWYAARKGPGAPALERGNLDGLTMRVSLDQSGRPVMVDMMNNCGCYHFFVPAGGTVKAIKHQPLTIDAFAPLNLPAAYPGNRLDVHVNADWHQVFHITADPLPKKDLTYRLVPYAVLEMLPGTDGSNESLFNKNGIAKGSKRIEPLILFSMGIPKVGSMRQRSHHALKLVGRSYFSDPYLFDRSFGFTE